MANNKQIHALLENNIATPEENIKLHALSKRNRELKALLHPFSINTQNMLQYRAPDSQLIEIEKKCDSLQSEEGSDGYCQNCGAPNGHNKINGKPWCFKCNKHLKITYKKSQTTWTPKFSSVYVEKAEIEEFKSKQKQLSILK